MRLRAFTIAAAAALILTAGGHADASVIFIIGNSPQANDENVLLNSGLTGDPVFGLTNQTSLTLRFDSLADTLVEPSSGQARIEAVDGVLNDVAVSVPGGSYTSLIFNLFIGGAGAPSPTSASIDVTTNGPVQNFILGLGNGSNFLTIVATNGDRILNTAVSSAGGFTDIRQIRIGGATLDEAPTPVPEPASLILLGSGFTALGYRLRRRRQPLRD